MKKIKNAWLKPNVFAALSIVMLPGCIEKPDIPDPTYPFETYLEFSYGKTRIINGHSNEALTVNFTDSDKQVATAEFIQNFNIDYFIYHLTTYWTNRSNYIAYDAERLKVNIRYDDQDRLLQPEKAYGRGLDMTDLITLGSDHFNMKPLNAGDKLQFDLLVDQDGPYTLSVEVPNIAEIQPIANSDNLFLTDLVTIDWQAFIPGKPVHISVWITDCVLNANVTADNFDSFIETGDYRNYASQNTLFENLYEDTHNMNFIAEEIFSLESVTNSDFKNDITNGVITDGALCRIDISSLRANNGTRNTLAEEERWGMLRQKPMMHCACMFVFKL